MDSSLPLKPGGSSFLFLVTPAAGAATLVDGPDSGDVTYVFDNSLGNARIWIGYGMTSTTAQNNAVVPSVGAASKALPVAKNTIQAFTLRGGLFISTISELGSMSVTCNIGMGI